MIVVYLFLAVPWACLQFVIVIFPDHTHLLFSIYNYLQKNNQFVIYCYPNISFVCQKNVN